MKFACDWAPLLPFVHGVSVVNRWSAAQLRGLQVSFSPAGTANKDVHPSLVRDRPDISTTVAGCPTRRAAQSFSPVINKTDSRASVAVDFLPAVQHKDDDASPTGSTSRTRSTRWLELDPMSVITAMAITCAWNCMPAAFSRSAAPTAIEDWESWPSRSCLNQNP